MPLSFFAFQCFLMQRQVHLYKELKTVHVHINMFGFICLFQWQTNGFMSKVKSSIIPAALILTSERVLNAFVGFLRVKSHQEAAKMWTYTGKGSGKEEPASVIGATGPEANSLLSTAEDEQRPQAIIGPRAEELFLQRGLVFVHLDGWSSMIRAFPCAGSFLQYCGCNCLGLRHLQL